ncbi:unnamed protein product [Rotaria sp. Silwood2]|nr:unnamed protein product [Rotaria sp. Silwood2]CAF2944576.1 unnamed protein product [Rotaria sp. Silwood2]CAF3934312.1 unnamed protein product [Rotaria sp. Silwood2]CAF4424654.1 unnamed protein product [Rotaria sp. Silwood2]CAF4608224.1 unnamed protein product [Rotaria sp. Silwood2]
MRLLVFLFIVFICKKGNGTKYQCNTHASCGCSTSFTLISRIVGGETAVRQSWSWAISLRSNGEHICGGSILSPSFIITAAHCFEYTTNLKSITILVGSLTLNPSSHDLPQVRSVAQLYKHPNFGSNSFINDLALLRLSTPLNMRHGNIKPICLPSDTVSQPSDNISMIAIGWGTTSATGNILSSTLLQVTLQSISSRYSGCKDLIYDSKLQFCAGIITGGKDTCQGDSGGPLMAFVNNVWQLYGITSYGYGCALPGSPGVYTRVSYYVKWIRSIMLPDKIKSNKAGRGKNPITDRVTPSKKRITTKITTRKVPIKN